LDKRSMISLKQGLSAG